MPTVFSLQLLLWNINFGKFLSETIKFGWGKNNLPDEIRNAANLLGELPKIAFTGKVEKDKLVLDGFN